MVNFSINNIISLKLFNQGVNCFDFDEAHHIIVTGSMDTMVRVWNPFVPQKPNALLTGHHMAVVGVSILSEGRLLFSISKDKCVRIWNLAEQSCIQVREYIVMIIGIL